MIAEHDVEPVPGLPGELPAKRRSASCGRARPNGSSLAISALRVHIRCGRYFISSRHCDGVERRCRRHAGWAAGLALESRSASESSGVGYRRHCSPGASARTTIYTLTNRRVVLRLGMALPKCVNLPLHLLIASADLAHARCNGTRRHSH